MKYRLRQRVHSKNGYALISTMIIGAFAVMFLMALASTLLSITRAQSVEKQKSLLLNALDSGLDYALQKINTEPYSFNAGQVYQLPSEYFPGEESVEDNLKTKLYFTVKPIPEGEWLNINSFSALYAMPPTPKIGNVENISMMTDDWKIVEMTAYKGIFSKSVRAVLKPTYDYSDSFNEPNMNESASLTRKSIFQKPLFADGTVSVAGNLPINVNGSIQTNSLVSLKPDTNIVLNSPSSMKSNGIVLDSTNSAATATINNLGSIQFSDTVNPNISITPIAPSKVAYNPESLMAVQQNGTGTVLESTPSEAEPLSGIFQYNSAQPMNRSLNVSSDVPAQIYVGDSSTVNLDSSSITFDGTANSMNLQVYYGGTNDVTVNISNGIPFHGTIYAPNAKINVVGEDSDSNVSTFNGALVGNSISLSNVTTLNLNPAVSDTNSSAAYSSGLIYRVISSGLLKGKRFFQHQSVSWQELNTQLVPIPPPI